MPENIEWPDNRLRAEMHSNGWYDEAIFDQLCVIADLLREQTSVMRSLLAATPPS